jgi:hypothetical protein
MTMITARTATLACRQDLARWIAMSAPQSRRVGKILERAFEKASELGRALGAKERRDNPLRLPELRRRGQLYIDGHLPRTAGPPTSCASLCRWPKGATRSRPCGRTCRWRHANSTNSGSRRNGGIGERER